MTKRFVFDLDDDRRAKLDAHRAKRGLRSLKEALHDLIDNAAAQLVEIQTLDVDAEYRLPGPVKPAPKLSVDLPVGPQPFTSRLKGSKKP